MHLGDWTLEAKSLWKQYQCESTYLLMRNTYMVREHHVAVLLANYVNVLCMRLCVSGGSYTQYTYIIGPGAQSRGALGSCKYFSSANSFDSKGLEVVFYFENETIPN